MSGEFLQQLRKMKGQRIVVHVRDGARLAGRVLEVGKDYVNLEIRGLGHKIRVEAIDRFVPVPEPTGEAPKAKAPIASTMPRRWLHKRDFNGYT